MVTNIWEAEVCVITGVTSHISRCVSENVSITCTGKGVEHTSVTQVDDSVATDRTLKAATINKLSSRHVVVVTRCIASHTRVVTLHIDGARIFGVILKCLAVEGIVIASAIIGFADDSLLTTTEDLEGVAGIKINGHIAPYLGVLTIASAKDIERRTEYVHTLFIEDDTRNACHDVIIFVLV